MQIDQARSFRESVKRLHSNQKQALDEAIRSLIADPAIGQIKAGDLAGLRVYKFRMVGQLTLLAYRFDESGRRLLLEALGSHENFYRDLKNR